MHNYVHHKDRLPDVFLQYFVTNSAIHKFNTRAKMDFHLHSVNKTLSQKCLKYKGILLWNQLPPSLKSYTNTTLFKNTLKLHLVQSLTVWICTLINTNYNSSFCCLLHPRLRCVYSTHCMDTYYILSAHYCLSCTSQFNVLHVLGATSSDDQQINFSYWQTQHSPLLTD